ncbi:hypothetical protein SEPCBS57363_000296 [Sporothrix epigloea]|uniref:DUF4246 domain-containing protein n=1 Tax=Sporothrix epigloea TaxID=1892477 RepID=A0ABP0D4A4_9PEZI
MSKPGQDADAGPASAQAGDDTVEGGPAPDDESPSAAHNEQAANIVTDMQSVLGTSQGVQDEHAAGDRDASRHPNTQQGRPADEALMFGLRDITWYSNAYPYAYDEEANDKGAHDDAATNTVASNNVSLQSSGEVEFIPGGPTDRGVKITSYINGLHPDNTELYGAIERVLSCCIKPWNDCLVRGRDGVHDRNNLGQLGPVAARIVTYGVAWENELPEWATEFRVPTTSRRRSYQERLRSEEEEELKYSYKDVFGKEHLQLPPKDSNLWQLAREYLLKPELPFPRRTAYTKPVSISDARDPMDERVWKVLCGAWDIGDERTWELLCEKATRVLCCKHPEPGTAFSYEEWKLGRHGSRPIVDKADLTTKWRRDTPPFALPHVPYSVSLQDAFRDKGLQVLVEISSIELTPETPAYGPDTATRVEAYRAWAAGKFAVGVSKSLYVELEELSDADNLKQAGKLNEHIAAVAMFAFDTENVTEPRVGFSQKPHLDMDFHHFNDRYGAKNSDYDEDDHDYKVNGPAHLAGKDYDMCALSEILNIPGDDISPDNSGRRNFQHIGSVAVPQGRLVAFPNVLEHRIEPFRLVDATKPGRYRWLTLYLVDPHYRVCSTRNVPPQQHDWWAAAMGRELAAGAGLPQEVVDNIMQYTDEWPMGTEEASRNREQMTEEHTIFYRRPTVRTPIIHITRFGSPRQRRPTTHADDTAPVVS